MLPDPEGELGRSKARNQLAENSEAEWLFFLDADDLMHPQALDNLFADIDKGKDAYFGQIMEMQGTNLAERYQVPRIGDYETLISFDPFMTLQMGHFVKREVFNKLKFNEDMNTGEDWEYYLRLWKGYDCMKTDFPYMVNVRGMHSTGPKSATGAEWSQVVRGLVEQAREVHYAK